MLTGIINPLYDKEFLKDLDKCRHKEIWAKIISLDINEQPLEEISGKITNGGSISLDGTSAVRRTCSFQMVANDVNINSYYWGIKTKFKLFVGLTNKINSAYDDIIWFPQGIYVISSFSTSQTTNNYTISIQGKDKMCLLNGELGGSITAPTDFGKYDEQSKNSNGEDIIVTKSLPIKEIIRNAVHQYAKEPMHNIIITDLEDYGLQLLNYSLDTPLYMFLEWNTGDYLNVSLGGNKTVYPIIDGVAQKGIKIMDIDENKLNNLSSKFYNGTSISVGDEGYGQYSFFSSGTGPLFSIARIVYGQTAGYRMTELTYPGDLVLNQGEAITALFDKIVKMLGEFEYFYDEEGRFVFQHKPIHIQTTWNQANGTSVDIEEDKYVYEFGKNKLITSFSNTPNLTSVKNDYSIWGTRTGISGGDIPIHLRYALDYKPYYYKTVRYKIIVDKNGKEKKEFEDYIYYTQEYLNKIGKVEKFSDEKYKFRDWRELIYQMAKDYRDYSNEHDFLYNVHMKNIITINNKEIILYPSGQTGYEHYYIDMEGFWRQLYNPDYTIEWTNNVEIETESVNSSSDDEPKEIVGKASQSPEEIKVYNYKWIAKKVNKNKYTPEQVVIIEQYPEQENRLNVKPFINDETCKLDNEKLIEGWYFCDNKGEEKDFEEIKDKNYLSVYVTKDKKNILTWPEYLYFEKESVSNTETIDDKECMKSGLFVSPESLDEKEIEFIDIKSLIESTSVEKRFISKLYVNDFKLNSEYSDITYHKYIYTRSKESDSKYYDKKELIKYYTKFDRYNTLLDDDDEKKYWNIDVFNSEENLNFWFDFMDNMGDISKYSVPAIGQRAKVVNDSGVKAIYFRDTPTVIFEQTKATRDIDSSWITVDDSDKKAGYTYVNIPSTMISSFNVSSQGKTAYASLEENIYNSSYCAESASISSIPIYYLKPNSVIYIRDYNSNINGEYIVSRLTIPLSNSGTMSISVTKVPERIY